MPSAEHEPVMAAEDRAPVRVAIERRDPDLDPQLVWRGKFDGDESKLEVQAPPVYIQERVHPKALVDDLLRESTKREKKQEQDELERGDREPLLFADMYEDFNGVPEEAKGAEFYQHDANWTNRLILGDSLQVMASLAEREGLRGQVQCIYFDPPYGIKFNSNFQWSTTSRDVKDGKADHITREPEQVKAFRDTWQDGIHTYLSYLRDRLITARDLLTNSGSLFAQIGDENVHRVRAVMDEVFGEDNFVSLVTMKTTGGLGSAGLKSVGDYILWYARDKEVMKFRKPLLTKVQGEGSSTGARYSAVYDREAGEYRTLTRQERADASLIPPSVSTFRYDNLISSGYTTTCIFPLDFEGQTFKPGGGRSWKTNRQGMVRLTKAGRLGCTGKSVQYRRFLDDYPSYEVNNIWDDLAVRTDKQYVVETSTSAIARCLLMATDPGDLVLDPTCGSGTSAYVAEQWGRRWITIDTSRVSLALARARIMGARYPYYLLADSPEGQQQEAKISRTEPSTQPTYGRVRQGFVYERVPHITLKSIANNTEIDVIWEQYQGELSAISDQLSAELKLKKPWEEWEIPREADDSWSKKAKKLHVDWWKQRIARQKEIDASIAAKADYEYLYDKPYEDKKKVRVAGPFTVESLSPHRTLGVGADDELIDPLKLGKKRRGGQSDSGTSPDFVTVILENLRTAGVQQASKEDRIEFLSLKPWPGEHVCAEGQYEESGDDKRAAVFIGPEFGTVARSDLAAAAREAAEAGFDVLITCAFSYDAHASEFDKLGALPVLKARMNADLHMAGDLANTGKGNLFVIFGEPDIEMLSVSSDKGGKQLRVKVNGVDVFDPSTGEVRSDNADGIACWMIDDDYNEESFFVRHAYFLGQGDPYKSLKTTLKAEIDAEAWATLNSDTSRPFDKPKSGRIAVKVINHLGDEVMKVFRVE
ncbi:site-specific DNA-methyltransferase [Pseudobythopirellula maris]|uniref:site-specific DNA-methyltransferase n=1 Tax=Pseudobythopirellula maris TaxID=2527991 RepID=UPI001E2CFC21|nr:DNA methyltransferase [Pseudobythopirellula maris]